MNEIDRNKVFVVEDYEYRNFVILTDDEKSIVWRWRNDVRIREWMTNKEEIPFAKHIKFIDGLQNRTDKYYWLVYKKGVPVAVLDIIDVDYYRAETEPGYYLNPELLNSGEGLFFNYNFRKFLFCYLGFEKVKGKIKVGNDRAYMMSSFFQVKPVSLVMYEGCEHIQL